jgi:hypothetical protein
MFTLPQIPENLDWFMQQQNKVENPAEYFLTFHHPPKRLWKR